MKPSPRHKRNVREFTERKGAWLIGCEGTKTEPLYISGVINWLSKNGFEPPEIDTFGVGYNTLSLVERMQKLFNDIDKQKAKGIKYERVFVVFDHDEFSADNFNRAIHKCSELGNNYIPIWSNESFELWLYLHFQLVESQLTRDQYCNLVSRELLNIGYNKEYDKADEQIATLLMDSRRVAIAIRNSKRLRANTNHIQSYVYRNPATEMDKLMEEIFNEAGFIL